jgi:hypothetical protein
VLDANTDRIKLIVEIIEITRKFTRYLPIIAYASVIFVFAVINILEYNLALGIRNAYSRDLAYILQ